MRRAELKCSFTLELELIMGRLISSLILLSLTSAVRGRWLDGIQNCRTIRCYFKVGTLTMRSWSTQVCGHSCGTVHQRVPERCLRTYYGRSPSYEEMCKSETFKFGAPAGPEFGVCQQGTFLWAQRSKVTNKTYELRHFIIKIACTHSNKSRLVIQDHRVPHGQG